MEEMISAKKIDLQSAPNSSMDLTSQLLNSQQGNSEKSLQLAGLTDSDVMGNLFMFIIAGHETSANSIHFCLLYLVPHPNCQRKAQEEVQAIFQGLPISDWEYERDLPRLLNCYLGAVLNEELRLIAPTITVPKI
jgi:cytochrome P450